MRKIVAVTFDLWDTLIKEAPGNTEKVARLRIDGITSRLSESGHTHDREEVEEAYAKTGDFLDFTWGKSRDMPVRDHVLFLLNCIECRLASKLSKEDFDAVVKVYADSLLDQPPLLLPKVRETLGEVKEKGYRTGLISNTGKTPGTTLRTLLDRMGVLEYFDVMTFSNEVMVRKPSAGVFRVTLENLRTLPRAAVHIGDDPRSDVGGAKDFGMYAIQALYTGATVSDSADGHVTDLAQVSDVLDRL